MCQAGSNARGKLKKLAVFANVIIILTKISVSGERNFAKLDKSLLFAKMENGISALTPMARYCWLIILLLYFSSKSMNNSS
jgi:hypothetical protein